MCIKRSIRKNQLLYSKMGWIKSWFPFTKNLVNGRIRRQSTVEHWKLSLQPLWNVIATSPRVDHGSQKLNVHNVGKFTRFFQVIESFLFHQLPNYLISDLQNNQVWYNRIFYIQLNEIQNVLTYLKELTKSVTLFCPLTLYLFASG